MLRTLRLRFADRPDFDLAFETSSIQDAEPDPWQLLKSRTDRSDRISLGDRDSCRLDEVLDVTVIEPRRIHGPTWERGLQDEDVATALDESYDPPP